MRFSSLVGGTGPVCVSGTLYFSSPRGFSLWPLVVFLHSCADQYSVKDWTGSLPLQISGVLSMCGFLLLITLISQILDATVSLNFLVHLFNSGSPQTLPESPSLCHCLKAETGQSGRSPHFPRLSRITVFNDRWPVPCKPVFPIVGPFSAI